MLHPTRQEIGHRLEPPMRVIGSALGFSRTQLDRPQLVEEQEGITVRQGTGREGAVDEKTRPFGESVRS